MGWFKLKQWHIWIILIALVLVAVMGLSHLNLRLTQPFSFINHITAPLQKGITSIWDSFGNVRSFLQEYKTFHEQHDRLNREIARLEREFFLLTEVYLENIRLRKLLAFEPLKNYEILGARVIGFYPDNWSHGLIIDRGRKDGVNTKQPVITYNGYLVGMVEEVFFSTANVVLLIHPSFVVGGLVQREDSRALGLVRGQVQSDGYYLIDNLAWDDDIKEGDLIVTSGMSKLFPKGLPIGEVVEIFPGDYGLTQKASLRLFITDVVMEEVLIILANQE